MISAELRRGFRKHKYPAPVG